MADPVSILKLLSGPFTSIWENREKRKLAKTELKHKAAMAQAGQAHEITLTEKEWELVIAAQFGTTWKDEYALLVGTSFIPLLVIGAIHYAFTGNYTLINGTVMGIQALDAVGVPIGELITALMFAASGISIWRRATK